MRKTKPNFEMIKIGQWEALYEAAVVSIPARTFLLPLYMCKSQEACCLFIFGYLTANIERATTFVDYFDINAP